MTPFFNTEDYLEECIRSVLAQSMQEFEYLLLDNRSTDGSLEIALKYAATDRRVRVITNQTHLSQVQNYNAALAVISSDSVYCKIVQADDWIFRNCLEEMVALADSDPSIGIVSSYRLVGHQVAGAGLPPAARMVAGRTICRMQLLEDRFFFGSPTTLLFRSCIVRSRRPFYEEGRLHEDTEACYEILKTWNFGFVHQILSFSRRDNDSITSAVRTFDPDLLDKLIVLRRYGASFLDDAEYGSCLKRHETRYLNQLAEAKLAMREPAYWAYHRQGLATVGCTLDSFKLLQHVVLVLLDLALNPKNTIVRVMRRRKRGAADLSRTECDSRQRAESDLKTLN